MPCASCASFPAVAAAADLCVRAASPSVSPSEIYKLFSRKSMAAAASEAAPSIHQGEALVITADDSDAGKKKKDSCC